MVLNGNLFDVNPIEMITEIDLPCYFDHSVEDTFSLISGGIDVFEKKEKGFKMFVQSEIGRHVRIHGKAPAQYRDAYNQFLIRSGLVDPQYFVQKAKKSEYKTKNKHDALLTSGQTKRNNEKIVV